MVINFKGRNSSCVLVYTTCSSYYISIFNKVNNVQLMEVCSDGGKIRLSVESLERAQELATQLREAIDGNKDLDVEVLEVCL